MLCAIFQKNPHRFKGGNIMISYSLHCIFCKKTFEVVEGSKKYRLYKQNMQGKFSCEDCDRRIELEARKGLLGKL